MGVGSKLREPSTKHHHLFFRPRQWEERYCDKSLIKITFCLSVLLATSFTVMQHIMEQQDMKNKKNSKSRKKRKQNNEEEEEGEFHYSNTCSFTEEKEEGLTVELNLFG